MKIGPFLPTSVFAAVFAVSASAAHAQPRAEVGASLISATIAFGDADVTTVGIPSGGFATFSPGAYASIFVGRHVAIEPQVALLWASFDNGSEHLLNLSGQVDYFIRGTEQSSPYVFAAAGVVDISAATHAPKSLGFGGGYRIRVGDRLTFRIDGRYTRFTDEFDSDGVETVAFTLSIGGIFGEQ